MVAQEDLNRYVILTAHARITEVKSRINRLAFDPHFDEGEKAVIEKYLRRELEMNEDLYNNGLTSKKKAYENG
jgi:hypothetical protein